MHKKRRALVPCADHHVSGQAKLLSRSALGDTSCNPTQPADERQA